MKTKCRNKHKLLAVLWLDADQSHGWSDEEEKEEAHAIWSYGLYKCTTKDYLILADTHDAPNHTYGGKNRIPLKSILKKVVVATNVPCHKDLVDDR